jgi:hypothetical protein
VEEYRKHACFWDPEYPEYKKSNLGMLLNRKCNSNGSVRISHQCSSKESQKIVRTYWNKCTKIMNSQISGV